METGSGIKEWTEEKHALVRMLEVEASVAHVETKLEVVTRRARHG